MKASQTVDRIQTLLVRANHRWLSHLLVLVPVVLAWPSAAQAQVLIQHDFEDGTTQGWISRGDAEYQISAKVRLVTGQPATNVMMTIERQDIGAADGTS